MVILVIICNKNIDDDVYIYMYNMHSDVLCVGVSTLL